MISGSIPSGVPDDCFARLVETTPAPVVIDARGSELLKSLKHKPFLVKPNRLELAGLLGTSVASDDELRLAMRDLNNRGAQWVLITDGSRPTWLTSATATYRCTPSVISPVNAIASGDCLAAGLAWGLGARRDMTECLRLGMACAIENACQLLPGDLDREQVLRRVDELRIEQVAD